jgi:hypothetical protein
MKRHGLISLPENKRLPSKPKVTTFTVPWWPRSCRSSFPAFTSQRKIAGLRPIFRPQRSGGLERTLHLDDGQMLKKSAAVRMPPTVLAQGDIGCRTVSSSGHPAFR